MSSGHETVNCVSTNTRFGIVHPMMLSCAMFVMNQCIVQTKWRQNTTEFALKQMRYLMACFKERHESRFGTAGSEENQEHLESVARESHKGR